MYSYKQTIIKTLKYSVLFILGMGISEASFHYSQYMDMTIGMIVIAIYDYLRHRWGFSLIDAFRQKKEV